MKLRVGLVGLGSTWQHRHAPVLRALADRIEIRGVYEQVSHRAEQAAEAFGARCFQSFRALILAEDISTVSTLKFNSFINLAQKPQPHPNSRILVSLLFLFIKHFIIFASKLYSLKLV